MANKITTVIDFVTTGAQRSIKTFRQSIGEAEGGFNKFKAGASSAFQTINANAGLLVAGAGVAVAGFGAKMIGASQDLALAAGKFSDATGLAVEDASRLIEVAGDVGVSTESIQGAIVKLNRAAGKGDLAKFGIELQKASDGATDVNATFLETIRVIQGIKDPTEQALAAQAAFGRGYAEIAELIGTNATELKQRLDEVSDAKVITTGELNNAREFRKNVDDLKDSAEDLGLTLGNIVIPAVSDAIGAFNKWFDSVGDSGAALGDFIRHGNLRNTHIIEEFEAGREAAQDFDRSLLQGLTTFDQVHAKVLEVTGSYDAANVVTLEWTRSQKDLAAASEETGDAVADLGDKAANSGPKIGDLSGALQDARDDLADLNEEARDNALDKLAEAAQAVGDALDDAFGDVEDDLGTLDLLDDIANQFDEIADKSDKSTREQAADVRRLQNQLLDLLRTREDLKPDQVIEFITRIRSGDVDELKRVLADLTKDQFINIGINPSQPGFQSANVAFNPAAGTIAPSFQGVQSAIPPSNVTIIYPVGTTPTTQFVNGQIDAQRNGTRNPNLQ